MSSATDIQAGDWIDRLVPEPIRPYLRLARLHAPIGTWLLLFPGWWSLTLAAAPGQLPDGRMLVLFAIGALVMRGAGCTVNDIVDRDIDAKVERTANRPLASGQLSPKQVLVFLALQLAVGFIILLQLAPLAIKLGVFSLLLVAAYPFMKRITWWPQAWLGITFNWGALLGYAAATGKVSVAALLLYACGIAWTLGYDTIYAIQDIEDDALVGVKSSARRLGDKAKWGVTAFYAAAAGLAVAAAWQGHLGPLFLPFAGFFALHLSWQASRVSLDDPAQALRLFKS